MNRIMRLARANMRRHRTETILLAVLVMLCMMLLSGACSAERNIKAMFSDMKQRTDSPENVLTIDTKEYDKRSLRLLEEESGVQNIRTYTYLYSYDMRILNQQDKEELFMVSFFTEENERLAENYKPDKTLAETSVPASAHPVIMPQHLKRKYNLEEGGTISLIRGAKKYTFTIAGFYECGNAEYARMIVTEQDYAVLKIICNRLTDIGFSVTEGTDAQKVRENWIEKCNDAGFTTETVSFMGDSDMRSNFNTETAYIIKIIEIMAVIILIAVAVMIGFRIVSDIKDQIVSIGVLEALGYRSLEISLSYAAEYFLIALTGCAVGCLCGIGLNAVLIRIAENMKGYPASHAVSAPAFAVIFCGLVLLISGIAFTKARTVRKYPPVLAFRKGIGNHHFGKSHFPLAKTRRNVHLRLALKGFADHAKQNIGLTFVMSITTFAVVLSFILYGYLGKGTNVVTSLAGHELSALSIDIMTGIDCDAFAAELEAMPEIRKVLQTCDMGMITLAAPELNTDFQADIFRDYTQTENIHPIEGRFPHHDNEMMISKQTSARCQLHTGDTIRLKYNSIVQDYLVTGIVTALVNAENIYLTEDGIRRIHPAYAPTTFMIYPAEGVEEKTLLAELDRRFVKSAQSLSDSEGEVPDSYEARIRAKAEQVMASMMEQNGASHVEYAIMSGDNVIAGNSDGIKIKAYFNFSEMLSSYMAGLCNAVSVTTKLFMALSAAVVLMILSILMETEVRRQRRELGIMKGLGYTSKELMLQLAFRIMPAALIAVVIGTVLGVGATELLISTVGVVPINIPAILVLDLAVLAFCFGCARLGARKIKKISVYELMTE